MDLLSDLISKVHRLGLKEQNGYFGDQRPRENLHSGFSAWIVDGPAGATR